MWRSDGWKNPHEDDPKDMRVWQGLEEAYEAGADDMLEKVVEWLEGDCTEHGGGMERMGCDKCWQALHQE